MFHAISIVSLESSGSDLKKHLVWDWKYEKYYWKNFRMQVRVIKIWKRLPNFGWCSRVFDLEIKNLPFDVQVGLSLWIILFLPPSRWMYRWNTAYSNIFPKFSKWMMSAEMPQLQVRSSASQVVTCNTIPLSKCFIQCKWGTRNHCWSLIFYTSLHLAYFLAGWM